MDPDKLLDRLLMLANEVLVLPLDAPNVDRAGIADDLAAGVVNLHDWLRKGGALPVKWQRARLR
jgi:hypothetical protein